LFFPSVPWQWVYPRGYTQEYQIDRSWR